MYQVMKEIEQCLSVAARDDARRISPYHIAQCTGINDIEQISEGLFRLVNWKLKVNYEVECPFCGVSDFVVYDLGQLTDIEDRECRGCSIIYKPSKEKTWLTFDFTEEFVKEAKKNDLIHSALKATCIPPETESTSLQLSRWRALRS